MNSCRKGKVGEREAASFLRDQGFDCRRGVQYCGGPDSPDVVGIPDTHVEVKRTERLSLRDAVAQAEGDCGGQPWVILHRWNNGKWLAIITAEEYCRLKREDLPMPVTINQTPHHENQSQRPAGTTATV